MNANMMMINGTIEMNKLNAINIALRMPSMWKNRCTIDVGMLMARMATKRSLR